MLDVDNAAAADQAPSPSHGTARRAGARRAPGLLSTPGPERPVLFGGIAAAVVLGLLIGFLTAPGGHKAAKTPTAARPSAGQTVSGTELSPPLSQLPGARAGGTAANVKIDAGNRLALRYAYFDAYAKGRLGVKVGGLTAGRVTIPRGVYYGVVEGQSAATDTFWAVGQAYFAGVAGQDEGVRHAWKRVGGGPWEYVGTGCTAVPQVFLATVRPAGC